MKQEGIKVVYNKEVTPEFAKSLNVDAIFVSVGASPVIPPIKGVEKAIRATSVLDKLDTVKDNAIIIGGGTIGCELALDLAETGKHSYIVELTDTLNAQANSFYKTALQIHMDENKQFIDSHVNTQCIKINDDGVIVKENGIEKEIKGSQVILSTGLRSNIDEATAFYGCAPRVFINGDCSTVARVKQAVSSAFTTAYHL